MHGHQSNKLQQVQNSAFDGYVIPAKKMWQINDRGAYAQSIEISTSEFSNMINR